MVLADGNDAGKSHLNWQGDGVDIEIESFTYAGRRCYRWALYDRDKSVTLGVCRTRWRAHLASRFARWKYRTFDRP